MHRTDPQLSTAKRKQRTQLFTSHMAHASLERQLAALQTSKSELESKIREKDILIERLESDRRWLAEREQQEREEKERERTEWEEEKVRPLRCRARRYTERITEEIRWRFALPEERVADLTRRVRRPGGRTFDAVPANFTNHCHSEVRNLNTDAPTHSPSRPSHRNAGHCGGPLARF